MTDTMSADATTAAARLAAITERQRQVLDLVVQHWTSKEIARELAISPSTVDQRINAVRDKLGARDRAETARLYAELCSICGRTIYGPAVVASGAATPVTATRDGAIGPVFTLSDSAASAPDEWEHIVSLVVPRAPIRSSRLWRLAVIVFIALGIVVVATTILAVMQALNTMI